MIQTKNPWYAATKALFGWAALILSSSTGIAAGPSSSSKLVRRRTSTGTSGPVKVVVLTGQSNMVGWGSGEHLHDLIYANEKTRAEFEHLAVDVDTWAERNDVFVKWPGVKQGYLTSVGFGGDDDSFGPETGIGWTLGDEFDEDVYIIKIADDGLSLAGDIRPESSGWDSTTVSKEVDEPAKGYGWYYTRLVDGVLKHLGKIGNFLPNYDANLGYELLGLVFFQGFTDSRTRTYVDQYETNLINLIDDLRTNLSAPDLPIVIGELGMAGPIFYPDDDPEWVKRHQDMRSIQRNVAERDEFQSYMRLAQTADIAYGTDDTIDSPHYYCRADTYYRMGVRMGEALLDML